MFSYISIQKFILWIILLFKCISGYGPAPPPPETTIKCRMFQTIIRHNGLPMNIVVVTNAEIKSGVPVCLREMWVHSRQNSDLQKWFWTQTQHQNQSLLLHPHVLFIHWKLREEENEAVIHALLFIYFFWGGLYHWLISNNKAKTHLVTCHRMISPKHPWFRGYPLLPPVFKTCISEPGGWNCLGEWVYSWLCLQVLPGLWPIQEADGWNLKKPFW